MFRFGVLPKRAVLLSYLIDLQAFFGPDRLKC